MLSSALPIFFLMLIAALLGFLIAWTWRRVQLQQFKREAARKEMVSKNFETERFNLIAHSNSLQANQKKMIESRNETIEKVAAMETTIAHLKHEKELLIEEFRNYREVVTTKMNTSSHFSSQLNDLEKYLSEKDEALLEWQNKYQLLLNLKKEKGRSVEAIEQTVCGY